MKQRKNIVIFSGAGVSAESGLSTFRDNGGLWDKYNVMEVATPEAWILNPKKVLHFYNLRRKQVIEAAPNEAHRLIAEMEKYFNVHVITQNIDDLHERAGSSKVLHLHGEIRKARSEKNPNLIYEIDGWELNLGDKAEDGAQLRPDVVWFGEDVPNMKKAFEIAQIADIMIVVGTSLSVAPASFVINYIREDTDLFLIDPNPAKKIKHRKTTVIPKKASEGIRDVFELLTQPQQA
ncbi:MAG: NAD-dependent deacylase [Bacteroidetes bacterium]|nr:MAG: NAD-dependent deacylase [Bacteroidota bacterium]